MTKATAAAIFFLIWWIVLFAVLPWGVRSQHEEGAEVAPGTDPGAPVMPKLGRKLLWTTVVACIVFAAFYVAYADRLITLNGLLGPIGPHFSD